MSAFKQAGKEMFMVMGMVFLIVLFLHQFTGFKAFNESSFYYYIFFALVYFFARWFQLTRK